MLNKIKAIAAARREGTDNEAGLDLIQIVLAVGISLLLVSVAISGISTIQNNARTVAAKNAAESIYTSTLAAAQDGKLDTGEISDITGSFPEGMTVTLTVGSTTISKSTTAPVPAGDIRVTAQHDGGGKEAVVGAPTSVSN